ncbi:hypothetical protein HHX47_DHR4000762 [Lentinula edodes]|nr:hypothetical protein HHX47_DHR4000762 [Lentinula edodes]
MAESLKTEAEVVAALEPEAVVGIESIAVAVPVCPGTIRNIVVVTVTVAPGVARVSVVLELDEVIVVEEVIAAAIEEAEDEDATPGLPIADAAIVPEEMLAIAAVPMTESVLMPVEEGDDVATATSEKDEVETEVVKSADAVERICRPRIARRTGTEDEVGTMVEETETELGLRVNKFCATLGDAVADPEAVAALAEAAEAERALAIDAIAAETEAVGKAPSVPAGISMTVVVESELDADVVALDDEVTVVVTEPADERIGAVAVTTSPVPRAGDDADATAVTTVTEAVGKIVVSSPQSMLVAVMEFDVISGSSSSPQSEASPVSVELALLALEVVLTAPAVDVVVVELPKIPPSTPAACILASTSASVSQLIDVPLLFSNGRAKQDRPEEHGVKLNVEPLHWAKAPLTQASWPAKMHSNFQS